MPAAIPESTKTSLGQRLRYAGSASLWGFAVYLVSRDGHEDSVLPSGLPIGEPERRWTAR
jgi:hypothetical protein